MSERAIEVDRDWRKQVRKAWYLRPHNFESEREYNDYLEDVEVRALILHNISVIILKEP